MHAVRRTRACCIRSCPVAGGPGRARERGETLRANVQRLGGEEPCWVRVCGAPSRSICIAPRPRHPRIASPRLPSPPRPRRRRTLAAAAAAAAVATSACHLPDLPTTSGSSSLHAPITSGFRSLTTAGHEFDTLNPASTSLATTLTSAAIATTVTPAAVTTSIAAATLATAISAAALARQEFVALKDAEDCMRALNNVRLGDRQVKIEFARNKGKNAAPGATQLPDAGSGAEAAVPVGPKVRHRAVLKNLPVRNRFSLGSPSPPPPLHTHTRARARTCRPHLTTTAPQLAHVT